MIAKARVLLLVAVLLAMAACGGGGGTTTGGSSPDDTITKDPANAEVDEAAEALLKKALRAANLFHENDESYEGFDAAEGAEADPDITWVDGTDPAVSEVSITDVTKTNVHLVTKSESGLYFCLRNLLQFGRGEYLTGFGAAFADVDEQSECLGEGGN